MNYLEKVLSTILKIKNTLYPYIKDIIPNFNGRVLKEYIVSISEEIDTKVLDIINNIKPVVLPYMSLFIDDISQTAVTQGTYSKKKYSNIYLLYAPDMPSTSDVSSCFEWNTKLLYSDFVLTSNVKYIDSLFIGCSSLIRIRFNEWDVSNVISASNFLQYGSPDLKLTLDLNRFTKIDEGKYITDPTLLFFRSPSFKKIIGIEKAIQYRGKICLYGCSELEEVEELENMVIDNIDTYPIASSKGNHPIETYGFRDTKKLNCNVKITALNPITTRIPSWLTFDNSGITGLDITGFTYDYASNTDDYVVKEGFIFPTDTSYRGEAYLIRGCENLQYFKGHDRSLVQYSYKNKSGEQVYVYDNTNTPESLTNVSEYFLVPHEEGSIRQKSITLSSEILTNESIKNIFNELVDWTSTRYTVNYFNAIKDDMEDPNVYLNDLKNKNFTIKVRKKVYNKINSDPDLMYLIQQTANRGWKLMSF